MAYVIAEPCINTKDTACVNVCPVDCIHPKKDENYDAVQQLYINPNECIDCGACVPECPVAAIFPESDLKAEWKFFATKNADYYNLSAADFEAKWKSPGKTA
jgi:NAD-dependent dihydropyrimidine dehydrogenase PreA subunit